MYLKWNKSFGKVLVSSVAVALTPNLHAIPRDPCEPPPIACCEEPLPGPFAFTYPFDMDLNCPSDFYFHIDGLAMQAKEDGLEFAIRDTSTPAAGTPITGGVVAGFSGSNHDFDYNPGMRIGMGFYLDQDAWTLDFEWTWLNITNYQHANATTALGAMLPLWALGDGTPAAQIGARTSARWDVRYNTLDVSLGKPYYVSRYLVMNPFFGLRAGWISQHYSVDYGGQTPGLKVENEARISEARISDGRNINHNDNDFWGVGARAGLNSDWLLGKGWCLFGNIAASMLYGKFDIDQSYFFTREIQTTPTTVGGSVDYNFYQNVPNFEIALGIGWETYFNCRKNHVSLRAAYEFHEWWGQNNLRKAFSGGTGTISGKTASTGILTNDVVSRGNFTLNGFSLSLQFDI